MSDEQHPGFTVKDRRIFADTDAEAAPASAGATAPEPPPASAPAAEPAPSGAASPPSDAALTVDFSTFVLSLGTSALYHVGAIADPDANTPVQNLPLAKQTIDILGMLQDKTRGNLDDREHRLLDELLYDLRMRYVEAKKAASRPPKPSAP